MLFFITQKVLLPMPPHILLEETGLEYKAVRIDFKTKEQIAPAYLKINPKGAYLRLSQRKVF